MTSGEEADDEFIDAFAIAVGPWLPSPLAAWLASQESRSRFTQYRALIILSTRGASASSYSPGG